MARRLNYFFLDGDLHKNLFVSRPRDIVIAWNYPKAKKATYHWSDVLKNHQPAFTTKQVAAMMNRNRLQIERAMIAGDIKRPQQTYGLDEHRNPYQFMWREEDVMEVHDFFLGVHWGRPRKDGEIVPKAMPTKREIRAIIHDEAILYVKQGETFMPTWRAKEF